MAVSSYRSGLNHSFLCVPVVVVHFWHVFAHVHDHVNKVGDCVGTSTNVGNHSGLESVAEKTVDIVSHALAAWLGGPNDLAHVVSHEVVELDHDQVAKRITELTRELLRAHHFNLGNDGHEVVLTENIFNIVL